MFRGCVNRSNNSVLKDLCVENQKIAKLDFAALNQMQALESVASSCKLAMHAGLWRDRRFSK